MISVSTWTLLAVLGAGGETVLLDFTAPWCGPCRSMQPVIQRLQAEGYPVRQVDIDQNPQLAGQFGVNSVPCFVMLADGHEVDRALGPVGHERLTQMFAAARSGPQPEPAPVEIRGQSPDRQGLGGRLRQLVGGGRGKESDPRQPPTTAPEFAPDQFASAPAPLDQAGPEPPAALSAAAPPPASNDAWGTTAAPPMAPNYGGGPARASSPASAFPAVPTASASAAAPAAPAATQSSEDRALGLSVRLRIDDGQFFSYASGSIVSIRPDGEAWILTCGHVFRDSQGRGAIDVELFGANRQGPLKGRLIAYDLNRDLGLVGVRGAQGVASVAISGTEVYVREGMRAFSVGCDRGAEPTVREGRVAGVNRYLGTPNLVVSGRPVVGRSGGGLFDSEGRLIGVCRAADGQADEGVYVSYQAIHSQLQEWGVRDILDAPRTPALATQPPVANQDITPLAGLAPNANAVAAESSADGGDKTADFDYTQSFSAGAENIPSAIASPPLASAETQNSVEPVFIVRGGAAGRGDVMLVERPSRAFLDQLNREAPVRLPADVQLPPAVRVAAETVGVGQAAGGPLVRGQSPSPPFGAGGTIR